MTGPEMLLLLPASILLLSVAKSVVGCCYCSPPSIVISYCKNVADDSLVIANNSWTFPSKLHVASTQATFKEYMLAGRVQWIVDKVSFKLGIFNPLMSTDSIALSSSSASNLQYAETDSDEIFDEEFAEHTEELAAFESIKELETLLLRIVDDHDYELTGIRDELWSIIYSSDSRPSRELMAAFYSRSIGIVKYMIPGHMRTFQLDVRLRSEVRRFLLPPARVWHEADPGTLEPCDVIRVHSFSLPSIEGYVSGLCAAHKPIQKRLRFEERIRNPYGLGKDIVISFCNYYRKRFRQRADYRLLLKSLLFSKYDDLLRIELMLIRLAGQFSSLLIDSVEGSIKVLRRGGDRLSRLRTLVIVPLPRKSSGNFLYFSALQLKCEIEDALHGHTRSFYPRTTNAEDSVDSQQSPIFNIPGDILLIILGSAIYGGATKNISFVCQRFRSVFGSVYTANPRSYAKELCLYTSVPHRRIIQFIVASVISIGHLPADRQKAACLSLALFLSHSIVSKLSVIGMVVNAVLGNNIPEYLKQGFYIDLRLLKTIEHLLHIMMEQKMSQILSLCDE